MERVVEERSEAPAWRRYGAAVLLVALATLINLAFHRWLIPSPLAPFFGAVALAAWYGGLASAVATIGLSVLAIIIWEIPPIGVWSAAWSDLDLLLTFVVVSVLITALSASRDRAESALRASERRFRAMLETANEGVWLVDREARTQYANDRMAALLGTTPEQVTASSMFDFVYPEDTETARQRIAFNLGGRSAEFDFRFRRADGEEVLVLAGTSPVRDDAGRVVGALGLFTDITARRQAVDALRLLDDAGRALASSLDYEETLQRVAWLAVPTLADWCIVDLLDEHGQSHRVAVACADPRQEALTARAMRATPTSAVDAPATRVFQTGMPLLIERFDEAAGAAATRSAEYGALARELGAISVIGTPLRTGEDIHGAMTFITTTVSGRRFDVHDLTVAEQLARRSSVAIQNARLFRDAQTAETRYRGLFEGTQDGIIVFDAAGACVDVNPALGEMVGYDRDELIGRAATFVACGGPWTGEDGERLRRDGQWRGDFELRRKNGTTFPVESRITSVPLPTGLVYVGVLRDVSERKRFEQLQEEFLSALAHDLKNPLTAVRGQTQLLRRRIHRGDPPDLARLETGLESIDSATMQMTTLLDELSDVMRLRAGQVIDLNREPTDLIALARRTAEQHDRLSERHGIRVVTDQEELVGFWDGPRLQRVLGNLLGNAVKYSPNGGRITVRISREGEGDAAHAVLSVEDRGVGIPAADLTLVFLHFRRAGNVESFAGSGIGLAGAKRIVELHGGTIAVESTEGEGSTFTVRLPLQRETTHDKALRNG
jgi:PAS domain S-box-containing protein